LRTARRSAHSAEVTFQITHPFHPRRGAKFVLTTRKNNWGEDRVMYYDAKGKLRSIPASWTSLDEQDLFARTARGRSWFRVDDLLRLCAQVDEIKKRSKR
jgi:Family of unknown function (DUF5372)